MKKEWKDPRIDVQKSMPNEYVATNCYYFLETNIIVRLFKELTDGKANPDIPEDEIDPTYPDYDKGFHDDYFDFINNSGDDNLTLPDGTRAPNGWYSNTIDPEKLAGIISIHPSSTIQPQKYTGNALGNDHILDGTSDTIYYWGYWPKPIDESNYEEYPTGPNGS